MKFGIIIGVDNLPDQLLDAQAIQKLAKLPGKQDLLAQLAGQLNAPISGLANVLSGPTRSLVYALNAIQEKKTTN